MDALDIERYEHTSFSNGKTPPHYNGRQLENNLLIGKSKRILKVIKQLRMASNVPYAPVLLQGETGTGKELAAQMIHNIGLHSDGPFVAINCAGIPEGLVESEIFGHVKGAFTGADTDRKGKFELAENGTIFLDEINSLPFQAQSKVLRVIQEQCFEKVGSNKKISTNARVISATNENLLDSIKLKRFREDLYHRLAVIVICLPPLRDRPEDIALIAHHFIDKYAKKLDMPAFKLDTKSICTLQNFMWPGNVRQLENTLIRIFSVVLDDVEFQLATDYYKKKKPEINIGDDEDQLTYLGLETNSIDDGLNIGIDGNRSLKDICNEFERDVVYNALISCGWVITKAAKLLKVHRNTLMTKIAKHNITLQIEKE